MQTYTLPAHLKLMGDANAVRRAADPTWKPAPQDPIKDLENIARARQERGLRDAKRLVRQAQR